MIKEAYCSYEIAKLLKEKGFPISKYSGIYTNEDNLCLTDVGMMSYLSKEDYIHFEDFFIPTITHQLACDWLREVHNILISIIPQEVKVGIDKICYAIYRITEDVYTPLYNGYINNLVDSYDNLLETTDKVGTRAVLLDTTDVNKVCRFIEQCDVWIVQEHAKDIDQIISEHPEEFTYQSDHYIVRPKDNYPAECDIKLLTCEIQVRTILQHAYAEISHDTMYKKDISLSNQYKRKLASSMAFLEAADEKFVQIYKGMEEYNDNRTDLQNRLIAAYKTVITDYNESAYNVEITLPLIKLLEEIKELKEFYENLDGFMQEKEVLVQNAISTYKDVDILFRHPVIVMALYMILNYQDTLIKNWPYNYDSLEHVVKGMNLSDDILH